MDGLLNPFLANVLILYPMKTSEILQAFDAFGEGYKIRILGRNCLTTKIKIEAKNHQFMKD